MCRQIIFLLTKKFHASPIRAANAKDKRWSRKIEKIAKNITVDRDAKELLMRYAL